MLQNLKPNDTIIWSNINGNEYQIGGAPPVPQDGLEHLKQNTQFVNEISHFGFTHENSEFDSDLTSIDIMYLIKLC